MAAAFARANVDRPFDRISLRTGDLNDAASGFPPPVSVFTKTQLFRRHQLFISVTLLENYNFDTCK
jgi:hypothetical protein